MSGKGREHVGTDAVCGSQSSLEGLFSRPSQPSAVSQTALSCLLDLQNIEDAAARLLAEECGTRGPPAGWNSSPLNPAVAGDSQLGFTPSPGNAAAGHRSEQPPAPRAGSDRGGMASQRDGRASPGPSPDRGAPGWDADEGSASPSQDSPANSGREGAALARLRTVEHLYAIDFENSRPDMGARLDFLTQPQDVLPRTQLGERLLGAAGRAADGTVAGTEGAADGVSARSVSTVEEATRAGKKTLWDLMGGLLGVGSAWGRRGTPPPSAPGGAGAARPATQEDVESSPSREESPQAPASAGPEEGALSGEGASPPNSAETFAKSPPSPVPASQALGMLTVERAAMAPGVDGSSPLPGSSAGPRTNSGARGMVRRMWRRSLATVTSKGSGSARPASSDPYEFNGDLDSGTEGSVEHRPTSGDGGACGAVDSGAAGGARAASAEPLVDPSAAQSSGARGAPGPAEGSVGREEGQGREGLVEFASRGFPADQGMHSGDPVQSPSQASHGADSRRGAVSDAGHSGRLLSRSLRDGDADDGDVGLDGPAETDQPRRSSPGPATQSDAEGAGLDPSCAHLGGFLPETPVDEDPGRATPDMPGQSADIPRSPRLDALLSAAREILRTFPAGVPTYTPGDKRLEEFIGERHDESQEFVVERIVVELVWPRDVSGFEVHDLDVLQSRNEPRVFLIKWLGYELNPLFPECLSTVREAEEALQAWDEGLVQPKIVMEYTPTLYGPKLPRDYGEEHWLQSGRVTAGPSRDEAASTGAATTDEAATSAPSTDAATDEGSEGPWHRPSGTEEDGVSADHTDGVGGSGGMDAGSVPAVEDSPREPALEQCAAHSTPAEGAPPDVPEHGVSPGIGRPVAGDARPGTNDDGPGAESPGAETGALRDSLGSAGGRVLGKRSLSQSRSLGAGIAKKARMGSQGSTPLGPGATQELLAEASASPLAVAVPSLFARADHGSPGPNCASTDVRELPAPPAGSPERQRSAGWPGSTGGAKSGSGGLAYSQLADGPWDPMDRMSHRFSWFPTCGVRPGECLEPRHLPVAMPIRDVIEAALLWPPGIRVAGIVPQPYLDTLAALRAVLDAHPQWGIRMTDDFHVRWGEPRAC